MRLLLIFTLTLFPLKLTAPVNGYIAIGQLPPLSLIDNLWMAVCQVESGCNARAYNHKEGAVGIAQIRQVRINHYNKLTGKNYQLDDCYDPDVAKEVFYYFAKGKDIETVARSWNGKWNLTNKYWEKVQNILLSAKSK